MGARRNWPQVGASMAPKFSPHNFGYNSHSYSYPNTNQQWQYGNQYQHGQPSQPWHPSWRGSTHSPYSYLPPIQSYPRTQNSMPELRSHSNPPLPLPPPFRPPQFPAQPMPNPNNNKAVQMIYVTNTPLPFEYQSIPVGVHDIQLRSGRTVTSENQNQPAVIVEEKEEEETPYHSLKAVNKKPLPSGSLPPSSTQPPFP